MYQKILFLALSLAWKRTESLKTQVKNKHLNNSCIYIIYIFIIYMYNSRLLFVVTFFCYFFLEVVEKLKVKKLLHGGNRSFKMSAVSLRLMKQRFWNATSRGGWWKSLTTWTTALLALGMACNLTLRVQLCFLTLLSHLSALCHCSLHTGGVQGHLFSFQVCFGMCSQLAKLQQSLLVTTNAAHHLYVLNMSSFSLMNMHGAITTNVTLAASLKLCGIRD